MDSQLLSCELCSHPFDNQNHTPRFIPECGHTLCTACILTLLPQTPQENEFQCPLDKAQVHIPEKDISSFPPNLSLIKIVDLASSPKKMCSTHIKEANLMCLEHNSYICEDCALFGVHQGHTIQKADDFESEFDIKTKEANEIIGKIDFIKQKFDQQADQIIENRRTILLTKFQDEFNAILDTLLAKKESITRELTDYFYTLSQDLRQQSSTLKETDSNIFKMVKWREQVVKRQDDKKLLEGRESPIRILQDDISDIKPHVEDYLKKLESSFDLSILQEKVQQARISFNSSFFTTIDHFFSFETQESDQQVENRIRERESINLSKMSMSSPQLEKHFADFLETPNDPKTAEEEERFHYILKTLDLDVLWRQTEKGKVLNLRENTKKSSAKPFWQKMYNTLLRTKDMSASFQHIKTLDLACKEFTDAGATNLGRALEKLVNLEKLQINFEENIATSSEGISSLGHSLGCLVNLRELTLNFARSPKIGSKSLSSLSQGLSKLAKLQRLRLIFEGCPLIDDQGLSYMSSSLIYLSSLTKLELRFTGCNLITDTGVTKVSSLIGDMTQLQKIKLDFTGCTKVTNTGVARLGQALTKTINLETIVIGFREVTDVTDNGFAQIAQALSKSNTLKHLDLDFAKCYKISNYALLELTQALVSLPLLQKLVLRFGLCEGIDDQGFSRLVQAIGSLEHLWRLTLDFNNYEIRSDRLTEKSFMMLTGSLLKLISLRHLELGFEGFTTMGDRSLAQLSATLSELINLREIVLDFTGCKAVTDNGVEKLSGMMPELMNLTLLWIIFKKCDQITAHAKEELRASLAKLNNPNGQFSIEY